jgi:hypothetical protein
VIVCAEYAAELMANNETGLSECETRTSKENNKECAMRELLSFKNLQIFTSSMILQLSLDSLALHLSMSEI